MEATKYVIVGTAGHIDHGKSTLVEALTGTDPDRLEEEKRRGITIDLGFAFLALGDVRFGFVDVPGHEKFVRNMLAGVGGIDLVVLVVAADESIKPQTREHFDICRLLGIPRGIVAITKSDLVDADVLGLVRLEIEDFVRGSFLEGAPIVPVSATTGVGLDASITNCYAWRQAVPAKDATHHFRLPIDRAFSMKGFGTVVTGTLVSGALKTEDEVGTVSPAQDVPACAECTPAAKPSRGGGGPAHRRESGGIEREEIQRGMVLAPPGVFEPTKRLDARITLLDFSAAAEKSRARAFSSRHGRSNRRSRLVAGNALAPGESAFAQLRLDQPVLLLPGDRFILRQFSPVVTIGGGIGSGRTSPSAQARRSLRSHHFSRHSSAEVAKRFSQLSPNPAPQGLSLAQMIARTGWTIAEIRAGRKNTRRRQTRASDRRSAIYDCLAEISGRLRRRRSESRSKNFIVRIRCCREFRNKICEAAPERHERGNISPRLR